MKYKEVYFGNATRFGECIEGQGFFASNAIRKEKRSFGMGK